MSIEEQNLKTKDTKVSELANVTDITDVFSYTQRNSQSSLRSYLVPMFLSDRALSAKLKPGAEQIHTLEHKSVKVSYNAAPIKTKSGIDLYFPSKNEQIILRSIINMISADKTRLEKHGDKFTVTFKIADLRKHLEDNNQTRSGSQISRSLQILEKSTVEVECIGDNQSDKLNLTGTYLQDSKRLTSNDPNINGLYQATLHRLIAQDFHHGEYRIIEKSYLNNNGKSYAVYEALIHNMRHEFTNADAKSESISYLFRLSDIMFRAGYNPKFAINSIRRTLQELTELLIENEVISDKEMFIKKKMYDSDREAYDYDCKLTPTVGWGRSQRHSNFMYKLAKDKVNELTEQEPDA